jgi:CheY-like chemotaxis protein
MRCILPSIHAASDKGAVHRAGRDATTMRILVADDNRDAGESLGVLLNMCDHEVRVVADGRQALEEAARFLPHAIVLDLEMPELDGFEAARLLRERLQDRLPRVALVAVTGWDGVEARRITEECGFDLHLAKPVDFRELRMALEALVPDPDAPEPTAPAARRVGGPPQGG